MTLEELLASITVDKDKLTISKFVTANSKLDVNGTLFINGVPLTAYIKTIIPTFVETDPIFTAWLATNPLADKQDTLRSGTNIKTINGQSILGSGDIEITSSSNSYFPSGW